MGLIVHAEKELEKIGMGRHTKDPMNKLMHDNIIEMVKTFSKQNHSGFSASYAIGLVQKLLAYEPIAPLTGEPDEWTEVSKEDGVSFYQNKRFSRVFKIGENGKAYDIEGKVFIDKDGSSWTNFNSRVFIEFPYIPTSVKVQRRWWKFWM